MNYLKDLKEQFTFDQLLLIFTCFSFTFPFYILGPILVIECIYLFASKKVINVLKETSIISCSSLKVERIKSHLSINVCNSSINSRPFWLVNSPVQS